MDKSCTNCQQTFHIFDDIDVPFYEKIGVPPPSKCPDCRMQQRFMFRNFFNLYHRECDLTGKKIISMYDVTATFPVYEMHEWWSDKWDGQEYGFAPDFSQSVFTQLERLHKNVPRMSIANTRCENTDYCNLSFASKNCYLVFGNVDNEDCAYGHIVWKSKNCYDCLYVYQCEYLFECTDCYNCNNLIFSQGCNNCSSSGFLINCTSCRDCFGCVGLQNKQYCIFNEQYTKEEYEKLRAEFDTNSRTQVREIKKKLEPLVCAQTVAPYTGYSNENCVGDYLYNCKNIYYGFDMKNSEDCRYCATTESFVDSFDCNFSPSRGELSYQCVAVSGYKLMACHNCTNGANLFYCDNCYNCKDCFGCVGLKNQQYCIFNKQYSKEAYFETLEKLITHMRTDGEYGEFFPVNFSPFCYNESIASHYFPLEKPEIEARGLRWKVEPIEIAAYQGPVLTIPDSLNEVEKSICSSILTCKKSGKLYRIIPQEYDFYKQMKVPIPEFCFIERHRTRLASRNPRAFWQRDCAECGSTMYTTYQLDRPERVVCELCFYR